MTSIVTINIFAHLKFLSELRCKWWIEKLKLMTTLKPLWFAMEYIQLNRRKWCTLICDCLSDYLFLNTFKISLEYKFMNQKNVALYYVIMCLKNSPKNVISKSFKNPLSNKKTLVIMF